MRQAFILAVILFAGAIALSVLGKSLEPGYLRDSLMFCGGVALGGSAAEVVLAFSYRTPPKGTPEA